MQSMRVQINSEGFPIWAPTTRAQWFLKNTMLTSAIVASLLIIFGRELLITATFGVRDQNVKEMLIVLTSYLFAELFMYCCFVQGYLFSIFFFVDILTSGAVFIEMIQFSRIMSPSLIWQYLTSSITAHNLSLLRCCKMIGFATRISRIFKLRFAKMLKSDEGVHGYSERFGLKGYEDDDCLFQYIREKFTNAYLETEVKGQVPRDDFIMMLRSVLNLELDIEEENVLYRVMTVFSRSQELKAMEDQVKTDPSHNYQARNPLVGSSSFRMKASQHLVDQHLPTGGVYDDDSRMRRHSEDPSFRHSFDSTQDTSQIPYRSNVERNRSLSSDSVPRVKVHKTPSQSLQTRMQRTSGDVMALFNNSLKRNKLHKFNMNENFEIGDTETLQNIQKLGLRQPLSAFRMNIATSLLPLDNYSMQWGLQLFRKIEDSANGPDDMDSSFSSLRTHELSDSSSSAFDRRIKEALLIDGNEIYQIWNRFESKQEFNKNTSSPKMKSSSSLRKGSTVLSSFFNRVSLMRVHSDGASPTSSVLKVPSQVNRISSFTQSRAQARSHSDPIVLQQPDSPLPRNKISSSSSSTSALKEKSFDPIELTAIEEFNNNNNDDRSTLVKNLKHVDKSKEISLSVASPRDPPPHERPQRRITPIHENILQSKKSHHINWDSSPTAAASSSLPSSPSYFSRFSKSSHQVVPRSTKSFGSDSSFDINSHSPSSRISFDHQPSSSPSPIMTIKVVSPRQKLKISKLWIVSVVNNIKDQMRSQMKKDIIKDSSFGDEVGIRDHVGRGAIRAALMGIIVAFLVGPLLMSLHETCEQSGTSSMFDMIKTYTRELSNTTYAAGDDDGTCYMLKNDRHLSSMINSYRTHEPVPFLIRVDGCTLFYDPDLSYYRYGNTINNDGEDEEVDHRNPLQPSQVSYLPCGVDTWTISRRHAEALDTVAAFDNRQLQLTDAYFSIIFSSLMIVLLFCMSIVIANDISKITEIIESPLTELARDMDRVSRFDLSKRNRRNSKDIEFDNNVTTLAEVKSIEESFTTMRTALHSFAKYVPRDVVQQLVSVKAGMAKLAVEEQEVTVLFSDIENFTKICEAMGVGDRLLGLMSDYFTAMSEIITSTGGCLLEFIGDAVLAVWNAPHLEEMHAVRAVTAALEMHTYLESMAEEWDAKGYPRVRIRCGIHTAKVLVGNIGAPNRMKYGVLGDGVNTASRLEETNKRYGTRTLISANTFKEVNRQVYSLRNLQHQDKDNDDSKLKVFFQSRPVDRVVFKGKTLPTTLYEIIDFVQDKTSCHISTPTTNHNLSASAMNLSNQANSILSSCSSEFIAEKSKDLSIETFKELMISCHNIGWHCFLKRKFTKAYELFSLVDRMQREIGPRTKVSNLVHDFGEVFEGDKAATLLRDRCQMFLNTPPPANWDGTETLNDKRF